MCRLSTIFWLALVLFANPWVRPIGAQGLPEKDVKAGALILIVGNPLVGAPSALEGPSAPVSSEVAINSLIHHFVQMADDLVNYQVRFTTLSDSRDGETLGWLEVVSRGAPEPVEATKILAVAQQRLQEILSQVRGASRQTLLQRLKVAGMRFGQAQAAPDQLRAQLQSIRRRVSQAGTFPERLADQLAAVDQDGLKLQVQLAGLEARRQAILHHIKLAKYNQEKVLFELEKIVLVRQQQLEKIGSMMEAGIPSKEMSAVQGKMKLAQADLADRRRLIGQQSGSGQLSRLNEQLTDVQIEMATAEARLKVVTEARAQLGSDKLQALVGKYEQVSTQLENALEEQEMATRLFFELKRNFRAIPEPKVVEIRRGDQAKSPPSANRK